MSNLIYFGDDQKLKVFEGIKKLSRAVSTTLGPLGLNCGIDKTYEKIVLHDGVSVANAVDLSDKLEDFGASVVREAARKQVDQVGDGTTAVILLAYSIISECMKITATGVNAMSLRKDLEAGRDKLIEELDKVAIPVNTLDQEIQIATISSEDKELGKMIGKTLHDVGVEGIVTVEESKSDETVVEKQDGMQFDKGYASPWFITNPGRMEATVEDAYILITDKHLDNIQEMLPLLEKIGKIARNFVVIANDITGTALETFAVTKAKGGMNVLAIKAPLFGDKQKEFLTDVAILTGGILVTDDMGMKFQELDTDVLGRADRVTSTKEATLIVGGQGGAKAVLARVQSLREQLKQLSGWEAEKLRERIAKLLTGVAVIKVGGHTEVEMKERKERAIDAVAATQAAMKEGIIPGGEIIYLHIRDVLDQSPAQQILYRALEKPFCKLVENAGLNSGQLMERISGKLGTGVDVTTGKLEKMVKKGIIDPVLVAKNVIKNAVSVSVAINSLDCVIVPEKEEKK
jgi:chaperonin GroEL